MSNAPNEMMPAVEPRGRKSWRRKLLRLAVIVVATYIATCVGVAIFQRRLIYFPDACYTATPKDYGMEYDDVQLTTQDGVRIAGWWAPCTDANATALFFHGNAGNISDRIDKLQTLHRGRLNCLMVDYRGYGRSEGSPSEAGLYMDADAAWKFLTEAKGISPNRIILFGESLGGAVAIDIASRRNPAAMVVECTFTELADVGRAHYRLLPVGLLLRDRFNSVSKVTSVKCPKLFLHGMDDQIVPIAIARRLFEAAPEPKEFIQTPGDHNEAGFTYSPAQVDATFSFLRKYVPE